MERSISDECWLEWSHADTDVKRLNSAVGALRNMSEAFRPEEVICQLQGIRDARALDCREHSARYRWLTGGKKPSSPE